MGTYPLVENNLPKGGLILHNPAPFLIIKIRTRLKVDYMSINIFENIEFRLLVVGKGAGKGLNSPPMERPASYQLVGRVMAYQGDDE